MERAIITGISGQDGAHLGQLLVARGVEVIGVVRSASHHAAHNLERLGVTSGVAFEVCELTDLSQIIQMLQRYRPTQIYNLAAQSSVGLSFHQPIGTLQFNILSVINLLEAIRLVDQEIRFYQASTSEMYGNVVDQLPVRETTAIPPVSPYGVSKAAAHWATVNYRNAYGLFAACGVLFNHESFLRGEEFFTSKIVRESVEIHQGRRNHLEVGNIDVRRDFGAAADYVRAMYSIATADEPDDFIICSGSSVPLRSLIEHVFQRLEIPGDCLRESEALYRPTEIEDLFGDASRARNVLGWTPERSIFDVLDEMIERELAAVASL